MCVRGRSQQYGIWLGVRGTEHGFEWLDGEPFVYANWGASGPPVLTDQRGCVEMQAGSPFWAAQNCDEFKNYMCKFPKGDARLDRSSSSSCAPHPRVVVVLMRSLLYARRQPAADHRTPRADHDASAGEHTCAQCLL